MDSYYISLRAGISEDLWEMSYGELMERGEREGGEGGGVGGGTLTIFLV